MITISVCMIVKNEEQVLSRCLDSLKMIADELIIVDTGSTDRTIEIAKLYTKQVYTYQWGNDFAAARNFSMQFAKSDYIYCADADEIMDEDNQLKFLALKKNLDSSVDIVQMYYTNQLECNTVYNYDKELRPKLYRRSSCFLFEGPVHEKITYSENTTFLESDICIMHKPLQSHGDRDLSIFVGQYSCNPSNLSAHLHNQYSRELFICGKDQDFIASEPIFRATILETTRDEKAIMEAACVLSYIAIIKKDTEMLLKYSLKAIAMNGCSEIYYLLGKHYESLTDYDEAAIWYYNAAYESSSILNVHYCTDYPLLSLARIYEILKMPLLAEEYRTKAKEV